MHLILSLVLSALAICSTQILAFRYFGGNQDIHVEEALRILRGGRDLTTMEIQDILENAVAGVDFPLGGPHPPNLPVDCSKFNQSGFYVDTSDQSKCQVFHRCDLDGNPTTYICPNMTVSRCTAKGFHEFSKTFCSSSTK